MAHMRSSGLALLQWAIVSLTLACGDSSGPGTSTAADVILVSGDAQLTPEVGTQLPLPLAIRVNDAQGKGLSGVTVAWETTTGTLSAASSVTDGAGNSSVQWTLGTTAGNQTATATVSGLSPVTFTVKAVAGPTTQIILARDSVELLGIGDIFRLNARPADRFGNTVSQAITIESADPSIVTADNFGSGAVLTAHASDKTTTVRATLGSVEKVGTVVILPPPCGSAAQVSDLAVGQQVVVSGAPAEFCLRGTASGAEFIAVPYFADFHGTQLRLAISTGGTTISAVSNRIVGASFQRGVSSSRLRRDESFEETLRDRSISELTPRIADARLSKQLRAGGFSATAAVPAVGDILKLNTNSVNACSNPNVRTGRVVAITNRAIVVADTANPANGFSTADYQEFGANFDTLVYPVDTLNFGTPTDIDNNQHVVLFFTRAVNELTPPGAGFYIGGFFFSRDLFPTQGTSSLAGCTNSNFAEMFYLLVPDPAGVINQNQRSAGFVKAVTVSNLAHEFQHLINASRRLYVNTGTNTFEDSFLDEGLAHIAEELVFYRSTGLGPRQNLDYQAMQATPDLKGAFDNLEAANVRRLIEYLGTRSGAPYAGNASITTRGAIWSFLRYAADRRGGDDTQLWFQLANPPINVHGIANITRNITDDLGGWVRDWTIANYADDFVPGVQPVFTHPSWNTRSIIEGVNQGFWPLDTQQLDTANVTSTTIADGTGGYLRFGVKPGSVGGGRLSARGATVPAGFALSVLRTK
jgi:hypothetical protein